MEQKKEFKKFKKKFVKQAKLPPGAYNKSLGEVLSSYAKNDKKHN